MSAQEEMENAIKGTPIEPIYPRKPIDQHECCVNMAMWIFGVRAKMLPYDPEVFWRSLSIDLQQDIKAFVEKWPPGTKASKEALRVTKEELDVSVIKDIIQSAQEEDRHYWDKDEQNPSV